VSPAAPPRDRLDGLADLEGVAHGAPERLVHVGEEAHDLAPARCPRSTICSARIGRRRASS
jgi:hypothetical protein